MPDFNIIWDEQGAKKFEAGTDHAVLYPIAPHNQCLYRKQTELQSKIQLSVFLL